MRIGRDWREREGNQRREERLDAELRVTTATIDPVRDPVTHEVCYVENEDDRAVNLSRRGLRLRCERPPEVGTRLVLQIHDRNDGTPIEVVGRTRWTRVEYQPGTTGARAVAAVGVELLGGTPRALDRYARCISQLDSKSTLG